MVEEFDKIWDLESVLKLYKIQQQKRKALERTKKWQRNNRTNVQYRLARNLRTRLYDSLHGCYKLGSAIKDLGCSIEFLKRHLESKFEPGMSWDNWGRGKGNWSIDHIEPLSSFDLTDRKQLLKACHWSNLQPMWHIENLRKGNKISLQKRYSPQKK